MTSDEEVNPVEIQRALTAVRQRVEKACDDAERPIEGVRLVAVSKTKPYDALRAAYSSGQRHFGENYVQEVVDKSKVLPEDICWHFIGHLQSNKAKDICAIPNMYMVETVHSEKLANLLEKQWGSQEHSTNGPLKVLVQVNTSGEENKSGVKPGEQAIKLAQHIRDKCKNLKLQGVMTIGAFDHSVAESGDNPDFLKLIDCRKEVAEALEMEPEDLELSMGMSNDFEHAIEKGSTNVRVGSTIFGARNYNK
eukprot:Clim_evm10s150 gene=Clim_evmTU10s150